MALDTGCLAAVLAYTVAAISPNMDVANAVSTASPLFPARSCCRLCWVSECDHACPYIRTSAFNSRKVVGLVLM